MSRTIGIVLALAAAFALGTIVAGWWIIPVLGLAAGLVLGGSRRPGFAAGIGAALAWAGILLANRLAGYPIAVLAQRLSGAMRLPEWGLLALTLLFPAVLASAAAALGGTFRNGKASRASG